MVAVSGSVPYILENNLTFDGEYYTVKIPEALRPYMGGKTEIKAVKKYK